MRQDATRRIEPEDRGRRSDIFCQKSIELLMEWLEDNLDHPYIERKDLLRIQGKTRLTKKQIMGWCTNIRRRRLTVVRDADGNRNLVPLDNPEKKRKKNEPGKRKPIILLNKNEKTQDKSQEQEEEEKIQFKDMSECNMEESSPKHKPNIHQTKKSEVALKKVRESLRNLFDETFRSSKYCWCDAYESFASSMI
ncbi:unnamed protein product [Moneuplotes crassus]|uniref:KN homeodomain domain-containing protein n=1 Tax=Euplotes crassus TaxID=5936 RepID=A0AAD1ULK0_EUPCR|nr:unnamed protein product [Moneuplotes crassus]